MKSDHPTRLFVYGTLRSDPRHEMFHVLAKTSNFLGDARVAGRLYDLGAYPGMSLSSNGQYVKGELYEVHPEHWSKVIQRLDEYEGCSDRDAEPQEYCRKLVSAELRSGESVEAWAYVLNRDARGLREIPSGDYLSDALTSASR
jgi:gamma-glutamylcyclotransferase (GGCT)/AIG2-like uncharacterized protein YtfP